MEENKYNTIQYKLLLFLLFFSLKFLVCGNVASHLITCVIFYVFYSSSDGLDCGKQAYFAACGSMIFLGLTSNGKLLFSLDWIQFKSHLIGSVQSKQVLL
jgi:hypothetical protein